MKKSVHIFLLLLGMAVLTSCTTTKKMSYFQNIDKVDLTQPTSLYDAKVIKKIYELINYDKKRKN